MSLLVEGVALTPSGRPVLAPEELELRMIEGVDVYVAGALAEVLSGADTDPTQSLGEQDLLELERRSFMRLVRHPATLARVEHMLETGKPLRN